MFWNCYCVLSLKISGSSETFYETADDMWLQINVQVTSDTYGSYRRCDSSKVVFRKSSRWLNLFVFCEGYVEKPEPSTYWYTLYMYKFGCWDKSTLLQYLSTTCEILARGLNADTSVSVPSVSRNVSMLWWAWILLLKYFLVNRTYFYLLTDET